MKKLALSGNLTSPWSYSAAMRDFAIALDAAGHDVLLLPDEYHGRGLLFDWRLKKMLQKSKADLNQRVIIKLAEGNRHTDGGFGAGRIAMTMLETDRIPQSWVENLNLMDQVWTCSEWGKKVFIDSGVTAPVFVVPLSVRDDIFKPGLPPYDFGLNPDTFIIFLNSSIGERHNIEAVIKAYFEAFTIKDNVFLLYHGNFLNYCKDRGITPRDFCIQARLFPPDILNKPGFIADGNYVLPHIVARMYNTASLHITAARGHGWNLTSQEALFCGCPTAVTDYSAHTDFVNESNGYLIKVRDMVPAYQDFLYENYIGSKWADPDVEDIVRVMRHAYENRDETKKKGEQGRKDMLENWAWAHSVKKAEAALSKVSKWEHAGEGGE